MVSNRILVIYDSRDGMTKKVADVVAEGATAKLRRTRKK
jgi:flavodoxin